MARIMIHSGIPWLPSALVHCTVVATYGASQERSMQAISSSHPTLRSHLPLDLDSLPTSHLGLTEF